MDQFDEIAESLNKFDKEERLIDTKEEQDTQSEPKKSKIWVVFALTAAICASIGNDLADVISAEVGAACLLYYSSGCIFLGLIFNFVQSFRNWRNTGVFWHDQNFVIDGKLKVSHLIGFIAFCCNFLLMQNMQFMSVHFAELARINPGLIAAIWSIDPLNMSLIDFCINGEKLKYYHVIGVLCMVMCSIVLSMRKVFLPSPTRLEKLSGLDQPMVSTWVPLLFGFITPITFTANGLLSKHLTRKKGFSPTTLSFTGQLMSNLVLLCFAIPFWMTTYFSPWCFWLGFGASIIDTFADVCMVNAFANGPSGPTAALISLQSVFITVFGVIYDKKMLTYIDIIGLLFALYGGFILVIPQVFERFCFRCCIKKAQK